MKVLTTILGLYDQSKYNTHVINQLTLQNISQSKSITEISDQLATVKEDTLLLRARSEGIAKDIKAKDRGVDE